MNNTFLNNQVLSDIPKNKTFKCDRGGETSKIIFSQSEKKVPIIDEEYFYGDDDLMNLMRYLQSYGIPNDFFSKIESRILKPIDFI